MNNIAPDWTRILRYRKREELICGVARFRMPYIGYARTILSKIVGM